MFDVYWTDHNRELVGERIIRKERERREAEGKEGNRKGHKSSRHSITTTSSASSEKGFGFFTSKERKKATAASRLDYATHPLNASTNKDKEQSSAAYDTKELVHDEDHLRYSLNSGSGVEELPTQVTLPSFDCSSPSSRGKCSPHHDRRCHILTLYIRIYFLQEHSALTGHRSHTHQQFSEDLIDK
jgi:hypothetical protein